LWHGGLRKDNQEVAVITGFYRSPGIAAFPEIHKYFYGTIQIPVDSSEETPGGGRMVI
jgi:hypothetical protein